MWGGMNETPAFTPCLPTELWLRQPVCVASWPMPLLRSEEHEGLVCKFYDGGVVKVGTTAADRFTIRLKDDDDFLTRLNAELEKRRTPPPEPKPKGRDLYRKRPTAEEELKAISAKNQKIYDERLVAKQAATECNAEERRAARTADPCLCTKEGATELLRQTKGMLNVSMQQTRESQQIAKKATAAFRMTLDSWLTRK